MSSGYIYIYIYIKQDLILNNLQGLISCKTQQTNQLNRIVLSFTILETILLEQTNDLLLI